MQGNFGNPLFQDRNDGCVENLLLRDCMRHRLISQACSARAKAKLRLSLPPSSLYDLRRARIPACTNVTRR